MTVAVLAIGGIYVGRLAFALGGIFHRNPIQSLADAVGGSGGSSVGKKASAQQRINIAFYGYGGDGHDGAYLSDSIMVVSIQPHSNAPTQVAEISIPRDWFVPIDLGNGHHYQGRINEAYSDGATNTYPNRADRYKSDFGGGLLGDDTIEKLLGLHIDHFVGIDFHAFQYAVDAVGGVDVVVPHTFTDYDYPHGECDTGDCSYMTVHFNAGPQHMNGATALIFSRSRHSSDNGEGTDFARSRRQQLILAALKQKLVSINGIAMLPDVLGALGGHVTTDLGIGDAKALYDLVKGVDTADVERVSVDNTNFLVNCDYPVSCPAYYLYARDTSYASISHYVNDVFPAPAALAEKVPITVQDGSGRNEGASGRWATLIGDTHLTAADAGRVTTSPTTHVILSGAGGQGEKTAEYLASLFGVGVEHGAAGTAPASATATAHPATGTAAVTAAPVASVTVILGQDEEQAFNHIASGYYGSYSSGSVSTHTSTSTTTTHTTTTHSSSSTASATPTPTPTPPTPTLTLPPVTPTPTPKCGNGNGTGCNPPPSPTP